MSATASYDKNIKTHGSVLYNPESWHTTCEYVKGKNENIICMELDLLQKGLHKKLEGNCFSHKQSKFHYFFISLCKMAIKCECIALLRWNLAHRNALLKQISVPTLAGICWRLQSYGWLFVQNKVEGPSHPQGKLLNWT